MATFSHPWIQHTKNINHKSQTVEALYCFISPKASEHNDWLAAITPLTPPSLPPSSLLAVASAYWSPSSLEAPSASQSNGQLGIQTKESLTLT